MNHVCLMGRLIKNPERKDTMNTTYARYTLAVPRSNGKDGQEQTDFIDCVCFEKNAIFASKYLNKGQKILIEGRIQTSTYEQNGVKKKSVSVIVDRHHFCEKKNNNSDTTAAPQRPTAATGDDGFMTIDESAISEDLPFPV